MDDAQILENQAVNAALHALWTEAIELNNKIIEVNSKDLSAYLRLGFAYIQSSDFPNAKKAYSKALKLQPINQLAKENLEKIKILEERGKKNHNKEEISLDPNLFIEIPGKTKSVVLANIGQKNVLAQLIVGQQVFLKPKSRRVEIRTSMNEYIGSVPDDLSKRLILFIKAGSTYKAFIKETELNKVIVFMKEDKRGKKVLSYASFPRNNIARLSQISVEDPETEDETLPAEDLERLAEKLESEEKDYLPFESNEDDAEGAEE